MNATYSTPPFCEDNALLMDGCSPFRLLLTRPASSCGQRAPLHCNRAAVTSVKRQTFLKTYPTLLVLPDGATIEVRYHQPRHVVKLPVDVEACDVEVLRRVRHLRMPREKVYDAVDSTTLPFDPTQYLGKK